MTSPRLSSVPRAFEPVLVQRIAGESAEMPGGLGGHDQLHDGDRGISVHGERRAAQGFPVDVNAGKAVQPYFLNGKRFFDGLILGHCFASLRNWIVTQFGRVVPSDFYERSPRMCSAAIHRTLTGGRAAA